ncbi:MAG: hypothetical protein IJP96_10290 [Synergistaceae bacterium]|nr:hypothetical protein [Synergistaceae bacterium]MBR0076132.1 hypothetical protein [Synergistaceae bacterium]MBR0233989.1 hypothetical protein [Synergistaceae bacterium]
MEIKILLWLSALLVLSSGFFMIAGFITYRKTLQVLDNLTYLIFTLNKKQQKKNGNH